MFQIIQERHFITCADLRKTFCEIQEVLSGISDMGMIEVGPTRTYSLAEFCSEQFDRIKKLDNKLLDFRNLLRETVYDACRFVKSVLKSKLIVHFIKILGAHSLRLGSMLMIMQTNWRS